MNSPKNLVIVLLALTTVGGAALAWHQYQELVTLRASAMDPNDRADLQRQIAELQKANRNLQDQLSAHAGAGLMVDDGSTAADDNGGTDQGRRGNRSDFRARMGQQFAAIRDAMSKPEVQAMIDSERKSMLDLQYAALFRNLNLTPDQSDKLKTLLLDRQNAERDVYQAARDQGINPRTDPAGFQKLLADAQAPVNDSIKSLLGDSGYSQFTNYEQTLPQRNVVNALQQRLSSTDSPLTPAQSDQLVQILASNAPVKTTAAATTTAGAPDGGRGGGEMGGRWGGMIMGALGGGPGGGGGGGGAGALVGANAAPITPEAVNQAQTVLNQTQVSTLQQMQQQQQTAQQIQQIIRSTIQQTNAATGAATGGAANGSAGAGAGRGGAATPPGARKGGG